MKVFKVINRGISNGVFQGQEFKETLVDGSYVGAASVPESELGWFEDRNGIFEIGEAVELEEVKTAAANAVADKSEEVASLKVELEEVKTAAANAVADLQGHLDQIALLVGAEAGTLDAISEALKTFKPKK